MKKICLFFLFTIGCQSKVQSNEVSPALSVGAGVPISYAQESNHLSDPLKEMIHISGDFCTKSEQKCIRYKEDPSANKFARCLEFAQPVCIGPKKKMDYWIDKYEHKEKDSNLPMTDVTWTQAKLTCEQEEKRLPSEAEWQFACEGEVINPYTTGLTRPTGICNFDLEKNIVCGKKICDHRREIDANPECKSIFGVVDMAGNADEWIEVPTYTHSKISNLKMRSALKGGHWLGVRNRCMPVTVDHSEEFHQVSIGFRCASSENKSK